MNLGMSLHLGGRRSSGPTPGEALLAEAYAYLDAADLADGATGTWTPRVGAGTATIGANTGADGGDPVVAGGIVTLSESGTPDRVLLPTDWRPSLVGGVDEFTVLMIAKPTTTPQAFKRWFSAEDVINKNILLTTYTDASGIYFRVSDGTTALTAPKTGINVSRFSGIAGVMTTTGIRAWADNIGASTITPIGALGNATPTTAIPLIGYIGGSVKALAMWDRALSNDELAQAVAAMGGIG